MAQQQQQQQQQNTALATELHTLALSKHQPIVDGLIIQCRAAATTGALSIVVDPLEHGVVASMKEHGLVVTEKWNFRRDGLATMQHKISW